MKNLFAKIKQKFDNRVSPAEKEKQNQYIINILAESFFQDYCYEKENRMEGLDKNSVQVNWVEGSLGPIKKTKNPIISDSSFYKPYSSENIQGYVEDLDKTKKFIYVTISQNIMDVDDCIYSGFIRISDAEYESIDARPSADQMYLINKISNEYKEMLSTKFNNEEMTK